MKLVTPSMAEPRIGSMRHGESSWRLMAAVLQTVLDDCQGTLYGRPVGYRAISDPQWVREAVAYVASTDRTWPFSFENLCEALGVDSSALRHALQKGCDDQPFRQAQSL
jgi:hypothetical protein